MRGIYERFHLQKGCNENDEKSYAVDRQHLGACGLLLSIGIFAGHSLRPDATADSAARMFHTARSVGRRIYALHRNIAPGVARGRDSLAHRAADPNRVRSIALRASGIAMDAVE